MLKHATTLNLLLLLLLRCLTILTTLATELTWKKEVILIFRYAPVVQSERDDFKCLDSMGGRVFSFTRFIKPNHMTPSNLPYLHR